MANVLLTPTAVTRKALSILHEKLSFIGTINRNYDDSFARTGAKIGDSIKIRLPNKYTVRQGKNLAAQDTSETSETLTVADQRGVDMNFSTAELAMDLDDFSERIIEPAMAVLASDIENDALQTMTKDVYNLVGTAGTTPAGMLVFGQARQKLNEYLAPKDNNRHVQINSAAMASMANAYNGLFNPVTNIAEQYREGFISRNAGLNWWEQEKILSITNLGDVVGAINETAIADGDTTLTVDGLTAAPVVGTVFTIAGVKAVHPETKQAYSHEQQFVVTSSTTPTTTAISFSPALNSTGANQNIDHLPSNNDVITWVGSASTAYPYNLAYHRDAFAFATADLELPNDVHFGSRQVYDGVSLRILRQYDINSDNIPCRVDVLFGHKTLRADQAVRIIG